MRLDEIAANYREHMDFYCVYIQEAHPSDGWQVAHNLEDGVIHQAPTTLDERADLAEVCVLGLDMKMPMLLDTMSDVVDGLYNALPERLYVIDADGRVVFKTVAGSPGFDPEAWAAAIEAHLGRPVRAAE